MTIAKLKRNKEKKVINNYPWIFRDEINEIIESGEDFICNVFSYKDEYLGKAFLNKGSNKYLYMITKKDENIDYSFIKQRILKSKKIRDKYYSRPFYRLVNAESDFLPGLIIDRYGSYFSMQIRLRAMENFKNYIIDILKDSFDAEGIYERSDFGTLKKEHLTRNSGILYGQIPDKIQIYENGLKFFVDIKGGQKTGFFFDQRNTRETLQIYAKNKKKGLDLHTYTGSFALNMAKMGMEVDAVDKSSSDIELARENASLNNLKVNFIVDDAMNHIKSSKKIYDVIILDPPSLVKNRSQIKWAKNYLKDLIRISIEHLDSGGLLIFCSCAYYINIDIMTEVLRMASGDAGRYLRILNQTIQGHDHPWILQIPETLYLKCLWAEVN
jgi:23S rRNA (cytosine1962-C5)-methyltransferase